MSKTIDLAAEYLQRDLTNCQGGVCQMENKTKSRENKSHNILQVPICNKAEPALSLYGDLLSYHPQIKFLGISFDNWMTFTKHFKEILERCNHKFHRLRILVNKKVGSKFRNHFTNLQIMCKTNIRIWHCFYHSSLGICHQQNSKSPELFH